MPHYRPPNPLLHIFVAVVIAGAIGFCLVAPFVITVNLIADLF